VERKNRTDCLKNIYFYKLTVPKKIMFGLSVKVGKNATPDEFRMSACLDRALSEFSFMTGLFGGGPDLDRVYADINLFRELFSRYDGRYSERFQEGLTRIEDECRQERGYNLGGE